MAVAHHQVTRLEVLLVAEVVPTKVVQHQVIQLWLDAEEQLLPAEQKLLPVQRMDLNTRVELVAAAVGKLVAAGAPDITVAVEDTQTVKQMVAVEVDQVISMQLVVL